MEFLEVVDRASCKEDEGYRPCLNVILLYVEVLAVKGLYFDEIRSLSKKKVKLMLCYSFFFLFYVVHVTWLMKS
jgi:hypothetical protein